MRSSQIRLAVLAVCVLCAAALTACQAPRPRAVLVPDVQYYDSPRGNIIEIPGFAYESPGVSELSPDLRTIQGELGELKAAFAPYQEDPFQDGTWAEVAAFPTTTDRYLNLSIVVNVYPGYGSDGDLHAWVYDREEERRVTLDDAKALGALDEAAVEAALADYYQTVSPDYAFALGDWSLQGFRVKADGGVDFYLYAANADDGSVEPWRGIFTWTSEGELIRLGMDGGILIPGGEVDDLGTPLWCQWPGGVAPEGLVVQREFPVKPTELDLRNSIYTADWGVGEGHLQNVDYYRESIYQLMDRAYEAILVSAGYRSSPEDPYTDENGVVWHQIPRFQSLSDLRSDCEWWFTPEAARSYCYWAYEGDVLMEHGGKLYQRADYVVDGPTVTDRSYYCMDALVFHGFEDNRLVFTLPNASYNTLDCFVLEWDAEHDIWRFSEYATEAAASLNDTLLGELWCHAWNYVDQEFLQNPDYPWMVNGIHLSSLVQYPTWHHPEGVDYRIYRAAVDVELSEEEYRGQALEDHLYRDGDPEPFLIFAEEDGRQTYLGSLPRDLGEPDSDAFRQQVELLDGRG